MVIISDCHTDDLGSIPGGSNDEISSKFNQSLFISVEILVTAEISKLATGVRNCVCKQSFVDASSLTKSIDKALSILRSWQSSAKIRNARVSNRRLLTRWKTYGSLVYAKTGDNWWIMQAPKKKLHAIHHLEVLISGFKDSSGHGYGNIFYTILHTGKVTVTHPAR